MSTDIKTIRGRYESTGGYGSTLKYAPSDINLTRFFGGQENGAMLQLTICNDKEYAYIQLTQKQVKKLAKVLRDAFDYDKYPSD